MSIGVDWRPAASLEVLRRRAEMLRRVRSFFDERGFWEVETPLLSHDTVVDRHLDPIAVNLSDPWGGGERSMWLQTSPEFGMKRLLAAGADAIYQITRAFRLGERSRLHNPEFTLVEWYRVGDDYLAARTLLADLAMVLLNCDSVQQVSYGEAFLQHVGVDPHRAEGHELHEVARQRNLVLPEAMDERDRDSWLNLLLVELVEPRLGLECPTILYDYPASQAALAVVRESDPPVGERFELYVRGIELANGYHELLDANVLRERNRNNNAWRASDGKPTLPESSRLLDAMEYGLPACAGVALGFDRLVMLAERLESLDQAMAFPIERA